MTDLDPNLWHFPPGLSARLVTEADPPASVLTPQESERTAGFGHSSRRTQFELGRLAVRTLAGERLGAAPRDVPLSVGGDGAPQLVGLGVSIAHTGRAGAVAALAALADGPVGVDLERVTPRRPDLWRRILNPGEYPLLDALGGPTDETQTLLWTLKEAVLKGQRTGFRAGGRSVQLLPDAFHLGAEAGGPSQAAAMASGVRWRLAFGRHHDLWLAVAWRPTRAGGAAA